VKFGSGFAPAVLCPVDAGGYQGAAELIEEPAQIYENINNTISSGCDCCADHNRVICELR